MQNIKINDYYFTNVNINLNKGITLLRGESGSGKTFLLKILSSYFKENNISFTLLNYNDIDKSYNDFVEQVKDKEFILLDNADLYMTNELWDKLKSLNSYIVVVMHGLYEYNLENIDICIVKYENDSIRLIRLV